MSKTIKELISEKLNNFQYLISVHIVNEENENYKKLVTYDADKIITFFVENVKPYLSFGADVIIRSFLTHLEIPVQGNEELIEKIKKYFEFFQEMLVQLEKAEIDEVDVNNIPK